MFDLYLGDCRDILVQLPNDSVDLTITSPPYDDLRAYGGCVWDWSVWKLAMRQIFRVTKKGGVVVWVVADATVKGSETGTSFRQALFAKEIGFNLHDTQLYVKQNPVPVSGDTRYYQAFEYMFIFSKGKPKTFIPKMVDRKYFDVYRKERRTSISRNRDGTRSHESTISLTGKVKATNIFIYKVGGGHSVEPGELHPACFPRDLVLDQILTWSVKGDTVLDPFMGSGTTGIVAINTERKFIGVEIDKTYFDYAGKKINAATKITNT
jgi:site-specific DNA-methyltransferase (adenine-specific)